MKLKEQCDARYTKPILLYEVMHQRVVGRILKRIRVIIWLTLIHYFEYRYDMNNPLTDLRKR